MLYVVVVIGSVIMVFLIIVSEAGKFVLMVIKNIRIIVFDATASAVWKGIFCCFMCCCFGFECMACVLCVYTCIELFNDPC